MACPHRAAQAAVAAGIRKPHPARQTFAMHSAFARQIANSAAKACPHRAAQTFASRTLCDKRSQRTAHLLGKLRTAQRWRAPIEPRTAAVGAGIRKPQSMRQAPRQITDSVTKACPHRAAQAAVDAGIRKPQSMRAGTAPDRGQRDESVSPSSRTGVRSPLPSPAKSSH